MRQSACTVVTSGGLPEADKDSKHAIDLGGGKTGELNGPVSVHSGERDFSSLKSPIMPRGQQILEIQVTAGAIQEGLECAKTLPCTLAWYSLSLHCNFVGQASPCTGPTSLPQATFPPNTPRTHTHARW